MMERETLEELACGRLIELIDQAAWHQNHDNEIDKFICLAEARELKEAMSNDEDEVFYMTYHRHLSDSFGVDFEIEHGDPELMFGGV